MSNSFFNLKFSFVEEKENHETAGAKTPYKENKLASFHQKAELVESDHENSTTFDECSVDNINIECPIVERLKEADFDEEFIQ